MLIYGKEIRERIKETVRNYAAAYKLGMAIVMVGEEPASETYVKGIQKFGAETGVAVHLIELPGDTSEDVIIKTIQQLNNDPDITGIMIQRPLPKNINSNRVVNTMDYTKDVEGVHNYNLGRLLNQEKGIKPCTPKAVIRMLKEHNIPIEGKNVVIIGRSVTVGSPLAVMMTSENATVTLCHSKTANLTYKIRQADIVVAAMGKMNYITEDMITDEAAVIDVGINFDKSGKMFGDVHEAAKSKARYASAVPGELG
jgi:methylenetetrahydrofolate dehydrogenase (NADP+)/methenyltetrahydrofolate cyclohydrolase